MDFVAIDVETANPNFSSICQVGVAAFRDGKLQDSWESLVNPEDYFDDLNVSIHGIDARIVHGAPRWLAIHEQLAPWLKDRIVVSHTAFDRAALTQACGKSSVSPHGCRWLDTARVTRRAWPRFAQKGYGLANVTKQLGIDFQHHNAREDARAAGEILLRAISETGLALEQWLKRVNQPIDSPTAASMKREGNPDGLLFGETLVFTGSLKTLRKHAADAASAAGATVQDGVTKHTTVLVVGDQDIQRLHGHEKSSKHRKAEELMARGQPIRILGEGDFERLLALAT